jgi:hypothetical protein
VIFVIKLELCTTLIFLFVIPFEIRICDGICDLSIYYIIANLDIIFLQFYCVILHKLSLLGQHSYKLDAVQFQVLNVRDIYKR